MAFDYRKYIEKSFMIDKANSGQLVPFVFNDVQNMYYDELVKEYDIERRGINVPIRENILKARREGFSSMILGIFAADDIVQENPTETDVLSYKDDATTIFRKRYRTYVLSAMALEMGVSQEKIAENINILEEIAPEVFSTDSSDLILKHNQAHFQCNTAGARVGGRGGVRHKLLFSEAAFYQDTEKIQASEMIEATLRQVDISAGWAFLESTENGVGTYQHQLWDEAKAGRSRFRNRFYGAGKMYNPEQIDIIKSEYVDMDAFRRDYPMTEDDLFKGSLKNFTNDAQLNEMVGDPDAPKVLAYWLELQHENGIDAAETIASQLETLVKAAGKHALYVGIDEAKDVDATVVTVLRSTNVDLSGGVKGIAIDTTRGDWLADWFEKNTNHFIKRVKFSRPSKSIMYSNLLVVIQDKLTRIPQLKDGKEWVSDESKHFHTQMTALQKQTIGELLVVAHPKGSCKSDHEYDSCVYHDDYSDSWALAEDMYVELNGVPARKKKPKILTVKNAIDDRLARPMRPRGGAFGTGTFE